MNDRITREDTMKSLGYKVIVLERTGISLRIDNTRDNFLMFWFDKSKTEA
jgi:hypothetical protein